MTKKKSFGICRLTGTQGKYVESHIIPRALTRLSKIGERYLEVGIGLGKKKRFDSWFDNELVTRVGEDILSEIDTKAIKELRENRLVWSGWGQADRISKDELINLGGESSFRQINIRNPEVLQVFFLSLLWRAAASTRPEFADITLSEIDLEDLRVRIVERNPARSEDYPIQLFQLITLGTLHNRTPLLERKPLFSPSGPSGLEISYVRFYFDGLIAHVHLAKKQPLNDEYLKTCIGFGENGQTLIFTHEFADSRAHENIKEMILTVEQEVKRLGPKLNAISLAMKNAREKLE